MLRRTLCAALVVVGFVGLLAAEQAKPRKVDANGKAVATELAEKTEGASKKAKAAAKATAEKTVDSRAVGQSENTSDTGPQK